MKTKIPHLIGVFLFLASASLLTLGSTVKASILDDIANLFRKEEVFVIEPKIELAPDGDINRNGEFDSGDIVKFTYIFRNTPDQKFGFATLKTGVERKNLNFIHNVKGTTGLIDDGQTIKIPNIRLDPSQELTISFEARINYTDSDIPISTEAEFLTSEEKSVFKSEKKEILAHKLSESTKKFLNSTENKEIKK